ncbi:hypothetical protein [Bacillus sp. 165]|uniref:hypothetical protein n=1 Tax=Bacillus sp. 165 TaxID=1529117 RepID=UPI001ADB3B7E|nr:hypothetical protein [Bacillus sp. 165]
MKRGQKALILVFSIFLIYALGEQMFQMMSDPSNQTILNYMALGAGIIGAGCMLYVLFIVTKRK